MGLCFLDPLTGSATSIFDDSFQMFSIIYFDLVSPKHMLIDRVSGVTQA